MADHAAQAVGAVDLEREPGFEGAKAARELRTVIAGPGRTAGQAAFGAFQIGFFLSGEGIQMQAAVAHQDKAGVVLHVRPFVEIEGDRIGALDAGQARRQVRRQHRHRAESAVDMKEKTFALGDIGQRIQIVDGAHVDRAGIAYQGERLQTGGAVGGDLRVQAGQMNTAVGIDRDAAQHVFAETGHIHRLFHATVRGGRTIGGQARVCVPHTQHAFAADIGAQCLAARHQNADQIGGRGAADQNAAGFWRKSEQFAHPVRDLAFDFQGNLVAPADVGIQPRSQHFGQHAHRRAAALHPSHEARMRIARRVRQDILHESAMRLGQRTGPARQPLAELLAQRGRNRLPDRLFGQAFTVIEHVVQHPMALLPDIAPA